MTILALTINCQRDLLFLIYFQRISTLFLTYCAVFFEHCFAQYKSVSSLVYTTEQSQTQLPSLNICQHDTTVHWLADLYLRSVGKLVFPYVSHTWTVAYFMGRCFACIVAFFVTYSMKPGRRPHKYRNVVHNAGFKRNWLFIQ